MEYASVAGTFTAQLKIRATSPRRTCLPLYGRSAVRYTDEMRLPAAQVAGRAPPSSSSPGSATTPATGTITPKSRPTSSIPSSNTRPFRSFPEEVVITAHREGSAGVSVPLHDRPQARPVQRRGAGTHQAVRRARRACCFPTTATTTSTGSTRGASSRRCAPSFRARGRMPKLPDGTRSIAASSRSTTARRRRRTS